jgi:hypothetical protein
VQVTTLVAVSLLSDTINATIVSMHISMISSAHSGGKLRQPARVLQQPFRSTSKLVLPGPSRPVLTKSHPCPGELASLARRSAVVLTLQRHTTDPEEEKLSAHEAFMQAVDQCKGHARIEGLQEFAAAVRCTRLSLAHLYGLTKACTADMGTQAQDPVYRLQRPAAALVR